MESLSTQKTFKGSNKLEYDPENDSLELDLSNNNDRYRERLHGVRKVDLNSIEKVRKKGNMNTT